MLAETTVRRTRASDTPPNAGLEPERAEELVRRIVGGDSQAEVELVASSERVLRFLARRATRSESDAEDLYQETIVLALEKIRRGDLREPGRLTAFLRSLLKNHATKTYRQRRFATETELPEGHEPVETRDGDPLHGMVRRERLRATRRVLDELRMPRDREVLFRYYLAEDDVEGICRDLGLDADHFYRVLHRARQRFAQIWRGTGFVDRSAPATAGGASLLLAALVVLELMEGMTCT